MKFYENNIPKDELFYYMIGYMISLTLQKKQGNGMMISSYIKCQCCYNSIRLMKLLKIQLKFLYGPQKRVKNIRES